MNVSDEAVEAAAIASYVRAGGGAPESWQREEDHYRREYLEDARVQLEAAAPHLMRAAFAEGHESGFWNGRESAGSGEMDAVGIEHEKATNPYRKAAER